MDKTEIIAAGNPDDSRLALKHTRERPRLYRVRGKYELVEITVCHCEHCEGHKESKTVRVNAMIEAENEDQAQKICEMWIQPADPGDFDKDDSTWLTGPHITYMGPVGLDVLARREGHPELPGLA